MGKIPEKHRSLPEMLPDSNNLIIEGKLYTISHWEELTDKKEEFSDKEKSQINNLYQHYKAFYQKRKNDEDLRKMQKAKNIAEKIDAELFGEEVEMQ